LFVRYIDACRFKEAAMSQPVTDREAIALRAGADAIKAAVQAHYSARIQRAASCCGSGGSGRCGAEPTELTLYGAEALALLPSDVVTTSYGCGNSLSLAKLQLGETVLDLGSGGGLEVLLAARQVGPEGFVYGLDMTDAMLTAARRNAAKAGAANVAFLKGDIESIPLPDQSLDVIISNCVINLAPDKGQVLGDAFRVLKPGGRLRADWPGGDPALHAGRATRRGLRAAQRPARRGSPGPGGARHQLCDQRPPAGLTRRRAAHSWLHASSVSTISTFLNG